MSKQQNSAPANGPRIPPNTEIAQRIADDLFGNSDRLVLSSGDEDRGRSGWSKRVVVERIADALALTGRHTS